MAGISCKFLWYQADSLLSPSVSGTAFQATQPPNRSAAGVWELRSLSPKYTETSGCQWTFLRPGMFAANALWWWASQIRAGDVVRWPYLAAPTAPIDERDIARSEEHT